MKTTLLKKRPKASVLHRSLSLLDYLALGFHAMWRMTTPKQRRRAARRKRSGASSALAPLGLQALEPRAMLYGYIQAQNEGPYTALNTSTFTDAAPGVLTGVSGSNPPFTAHLVSQAANGTVTVNGDGSWPCTPNPGFSGSDSFQYDATDSANDTSYPATVSLNVEVGALSAVDQTKLPADTLSVPM
jgi:hypothetical protein